MGLFSGLFRRSRPDAKKETAAQPLQGIGVQSGGELALRVGNVQGIGSRERQEDSFAVINAADVAELKRRGLFAVVADGMGGMLDGRQASEVAVTGLTQLFYALDDEGDIPAQFRNGVTAVSDSVFQRFDGRSGTTAVAVWVHQGNLHWLSVGDSAIFLMRNGGVFQLNCEHSCLNDLYRRELEQETIDKARAETDEDARRLTSFVGIDCLERIEVSLRPLPLQKGDVILLCSDGVSGALTGPELMEAMSLPPDEGCKLLETLVLEKQVWGQDNYTGVMISCQ